ncbi:MAG: hypothetical protein OEV36_06665, partial [Myxococcales bacterium]|nr:hypothetical protein [Myxococcales bacterium]
MSGKSILWSLTLTLGLTLGACGSGTTGSSAAAVREAINRCQDQLANCDPATSDCETAAMECMNAVDGHGASQDDVAGHCDDLHSLCLTKTDDVAFCDDLR